MDELVSPLQDKLEDWKKNTVQIDKDHAKGTIINLKISFPKKQNTRTKATVPVCSCSASYQRPSFNWWPLGRLS